MKERPNRVVLGVVALTAIIVGILSLLGVRPMQSRTIEVTLGAAAVIGGLVLLGMTWRKRYRGDPSPTA
jgi:hypothetical protein